MKKWYAATIRNGLSKDFYGITNIEKYAGKIVYVYKFHSDWVSYSGRLFNNDRSTNYSWTNDCFSEVREL
jgi:hypothetical protein